MPINKDWNDDLTAATAANKLRGKHGIVGTWDEIIQKDHVSDYFCNGTTEEIQKLYSQTNPEQEPPKRTR